MGEMGAIEAACHYNSNSLRLSAVGRAQKLLKREEMNVIEGRECRRVRERREEREKKRERKSKVSKD